MPLKLGRWEFNEDGKEMTLELSNVNIDGRVTGNILLPAPLSPAPIVGTWEETSRILVFSLLTSASASTGWHKFYKGFLMSTPRIPVLGQDFVWTLTGYVQYTDPDYQEYDTGFKSSKRTMFGWFAQIKEIS